MFDVSHFTLKLKHYHNTDAVHAPRLFVFYNGINNEM